jgi:hypothetical protein
MRLNDEDSGLDNGSVRAMSARLAAAEKRGAALEAALSNIEDPWAINPDGSLFCWFCGADREAKHQDDCPWLAIAALAAPGADKGECADYPRM